MRISFLEDNNPGLESLYERGDTLPAYSRIDMICAAASSRYRAGRRLNVVLLSIVVEFDGKRSGDQGRRN